MNTDFDDIQVFENADEVSDEEESLESYDDSEIEICAANEKDAISIDLPDEDGSGSEDDQENNDEGAEEQNHEQQQNQPTPEEQPNEDAAAAQATVAPEQPNEDTAIAQATVAPTEHEEAPAAKKRRGDNNVKACKLFIPKSQTSCSSQANVSSEMQLVKK
jgi:hypothetical protein